MGDPKPTPSYNTRLAGVGLELAATVAGACLLGYWIDRRFNVSPWGLVTCAVLGIVGGLYNLIRQAMLNAPRNKKRSDEDNGGARQ